VSDEQALATVEAARAGGVRAFDTAPHYGLGLAEISGAAGVLLPVAALRFPPRHSAVLSVAVGCRTPQEAREALAGPGAELPESLWPALEA
jgi:D-threo-aldose 1-dehydrogenase